MTKGEILNIVNAAFRGAWLPVTDYNAGEQVSNGGNTYRAKADFTSGGSFDVTKWDVVAQGGSPADGTVTEAKLDAGLLKKVNDTRQSANLINSANYSVDNLQVFTGAYDLVKPIFVKQTGNPTCSILKNYQNFGWAARYVMPAQNDRVNYFSNRFNVNASGVKTGDSLFMGFFAYIPAGATINIFSGIRQSSTPASSYQPTTEQIPLGNGWIYVRSTVAITVPTVSDGLMEAYIYVINQGTTSATVYIASPSLLKTGSPLVPTQYMGAETIPVVPDVTALTNRDELAGVSYNPITDVNFAAQTVGASTVTAPWTLATGGGGTFAATNLFVSELTPTGNKALRMALQKRSSDNFITDGQIYQRFIVPVEQLGLTKLSAGYWVRRDSYDVVPLFFFQFFSDTAGGAFISNYSSSLAVASTETLGTYFLAKFENVPVPANTKLIQVTVRLQYNTASTVLDTVKYGYISTPIVSLGSAKLASLPYNAYEVAKRAAQDQLALLPSTDVPGNLAQTQFNPVRDINFASQTIGSLALTSPWTIASGGSGRYTAAYQLVSDNNPVGNRAVKITHNKRSSDGLATDIRIGQIVAVPAEFTGATAMALGVWMKRSAVSVNVLQGYFNFYSDAAGTVLISAGSYGTISFTETAVGSYFLFKLNNIVLPAGTLSVQISIRSQYEATAAADTDAYLYLTTPIIQFGVTSISALPYNLDERAKSIATTVFNNLAPTLVGGGGNVDKRKLSYGNRMRRTLSKLLSMSTDGQANVQNKRDDAVRIVHLGDSIVAQAWSSSHLITGVSGSSDGRDFLGLEKKYPFANFSVTNAGVGGQSAVHFKKHIWHQAIPYDADLIILSSWGNDGMENWASSTEQFYSSYEEILRYLRKHTTADIAICSYSLAPISTRTYQQVVGSPGHKILLELSQKYDCEFIDIARYQRDFGAKQTVPFYSDATDITEWSNRGYWPVADVHPNTTGQTLLAAAVAEHFPTVNDLLTDFDWNQGRTEWGAKRPVIQAEAVFEYLDSSIRLSDETKFYLQGSAFSEDDSLDSRDMLASLNATADGEYIEIDFEGNALDLVFMQKTDGAAASVLIDGVAPSALSCAAIWYPDAEVANTYNAGSKREAMLRYVPGRWKVTEVLTVTMTGTAGQLSSTYNLVGSVSGTLLTGISNTVATKVTLGDGSFLWLRPENWYGRTTSIYTADKFYVRVRNEQALPLTSMRTWSDGGNDRKFPLIDAPSTLDNELMLRFAMTSATAFRVDIVRRQDRTGEAVTLNVVTALGTGNVTDAGWSGGGFTITAAELTYVNGKAASGNVFYYFVHRKFVDSITCQAGTTQYKKVRIASSLDNKKHTLRITKVGTGKLYIDSIRPHRPSTIL
jgi:hypothetical protein